MQHCVIRVSVLRHPRPGNDLGTYMCASRQILNLEVTLRNTRAPIIGALIAAIAVVTGCGLTATSPADGRLVLADSQPLDDYNPLLGYGELGVSPIYEGLLKPSAHDDTHLPALVPALAEAKPTPIGPSQWRVPLRPNVSFSDGTQFDAEDVVATYRAARDPRVAASIATDITAIGDIRADGPLAVVVRMATGAAPDPYLLLGIIPSERVETRPAADWALNTTPVGTGPYTLDSLRPDQAVMTAREHYWGTPPSVSTIIYTYTPDDNTRVQRVIADEVDGTAIPPRLAAALKRNPDLDVRATATADWRSVSLPAGNPFTADRAARLAMNVGIDRDGIVRDVLGGNGEPAHSPVPRVYGELYEPSAHYRFDTTAANELLDEAGWKRSSDGVRVRNGARAAFTLLYPAQDSVRRDLAMSFGAAMKPLGIAVTLRGSSWDDIDTRLHNDAVLLGGGETPYSTDAQIFTTLHTRLPNSSPYANPGNFTAPGLDTSLEQARDSSPGAARTAAYRSAQIRYHRQPSAIFLAFVHHTYVSRKGAFAPAPPILEPHSHGVTWGPWWNLTDSERTR